MNVLNFDYKDIVDQEIFIKDEIEFVEQKFKIWATTVSGNPDKPNEDGFALKIKDGSLWIAVFDGTTSLKNIPAIKGSVQGFLHII